ncbi:MAG: hypothetical protein QGH15_21400 [Kiritimatiellia bacterium]|jgi:hypothetical protein|nr:hypothetical protein [Kiritimatiellia bacterium]
MAALIRPPGTYVHGISLSNFYPCQALSRHGRLVAPDFFAIGDPELRAAHTSVRQTSIDYLRTKGLPESIMTPRAGECVQIAAIIRGGGHVGIGADNTKWFSREHMNKILRRGDIELELEEVRREVRPESASRLCSLWVAEDSDVGKAHVRDMLGPDVFVLRVSVPYAIRFTRVDTTWFERYSRTRMREYAENYWNGRHSGDAATWEFLVEGCIEAVDSADLEYIRENGGHLELQRRQRERVESATEPHDGSTSDPPPPVS